MDWGVGMARVSVYLNQQKEIEGVLYKTVAYEKSKVKIVAEGYIGECWISTSSWKTGKLPKYVVEEFKPIVQELYEEPKILEFYQDILKEYQEEEVIKMLLAKAKEEKKEIIEFHQSVIKDTETLKRLDKTNGTYVKRKQI